MLAYPYSHGWPLWPFTRLSPKEMEKLLKKIEGKQVVDRFEDLGDAPW